MTEIKIHNPNRLPLIDYRSVKPLQGNLKDLKTANYEKLKAVLLKRGFTVPLFVWFHDKEYWLMDGHGRQRVMMRENMTPYEVPCLFIEAKNIKDAKAQLLEISSQYQTITHEGFDEFTDELENEDFENVVFDALAFVNKEDEPDVEEDEAPPVADVAVSKLGEIYQLGRHKLMCADATDFGAVSDLMDGAEADMVFTDPPYNVNYKSRSGNGYAEGKFHHKAVFNDNKTPEEFQEFLYSVGECIDGVAKEGCPIYIWHHDGGFRAEPFYNVFKKFGWTRDSSIIWVKNLASMGWQFYRQQHETCSYGWKQGKPYQDKRRDQTSTWLESKDATQTYQHPTQKPISLAARAISNSSQINNVVLDLFGGSGSTLIACEQLDRTCYMMEIDPKYCDVIRKRYAKFTNNNELPNNWEQLTPVINKEVANG